MRSGKHANWRFCPASGEPKYTEENVPLGRVIRAVGGSEMMLAFIQIMPTLPDVLAKIDREIARVA